MVALLLTVPSDQWTHEVPIPTTIDGPDGFPLTQSPKITDTLYQFARVTFDIAKEGFLIDYDPSIKMFLVDDGRQFWMVPEDSIQLGESNNEHN